AHSGNESEVSFFGTSSSGKEYALRPGLLFSKINGILILIPPMPGIAHQSLLLSSSPSLQSTENQTAQGRTFLEAVHPEYWTRGGLLRASQGSQASLLQIP